MSVVWLHGASVGDIRALLPLSEHLSRARPELRFHLSAVTATGRQMARELFPESEVTRPPLELPGFALRALRRVKPSILVLEYLELWPLWVNACHRLHIPVVIVDGHITHRSLRIKPLLRRAAGRLSLFCAQTALDARRAIELGVCPDRVEIFGNAKYDAAAQKRVEVPEALRHHIGEFDLVIGSLHPSEEGEFVRSLDNIEGRILVAPRYPRRAGPLVRMLRARGLDVSLRSGPGSDSQFVVLDTIGELAGAYGLGKVAIVGGSFGRREGQNLVEAAAHGLPIIHGPRHANIDVEVQAFRDRGSWGVNTWSEAFKMAGLRLRCPGPDPRHALNELSGAAPRQMKSILPLIDFQT